MMPRGLHRAGHQEGHGRVALTDEQQALIDRVNASNEIFRGVVANVGPDQWDAPTVNDDWDVRGVVNHIISGSIWTNTIGSGNGSDWPEGDHIGSDEPWRAHQAQHDAMLQVFDDPEAWNQTMQGPFGELPAGEVLSFREGELLHHSWDIAKATGQSTDIAPAASEAMLAGMRVAFGEYDRTGWDTYKPELLVADDAPAMDRLAAFLGKPVD